MKRSLYTMAACAAVTAGLPAAAASQSADDEAAVVATVQRLFDGMRANDADILRSVFADGAVLISTERDGQPATSVNPVEGFINAVGSATVPLDEPFWDYVVQVHDHLATVWTKYALYVDGEFSHCGYDAFILARSAEGWKIAAVADTRESENCELPPGRL